MSRVLAALSASALAACGFTLAAMGTAPDDAGTDASSEAADGGGDDASYELPPEPEAGTATDASADGAIAVDASTCGVVGDGCSSQRDCCTKTFCGRRSYFDPYRCTACIDDGSRCNSDTSCCSGRCGFGRCY